MPKIEFVIVYGFKINLFFLHPEFIKSRASIISIIGSHLSFQLSVGFLFFLDQEPTFTRTKYPNLSQDASIASRREGVFINQRLLHFYLLLPTLSLSHLIVSFVLNFKIESDVRFIFTKLCS